MSALTLLALLAFGIACDRWMARHKRPSQLPEGRLVSRTGFQPLPMQREAMDQLLEHSRKMRAAQDTAQFLYDQARARAKTERSLL